MKIEKVLLAGATGYLGHYVLKELLNRGYFVTVIARNINKIDAELTKNPKLKLIKAEVTQAESIKDCCFGIDAVISTVGMTKQKDKLSFMDIDYQANLNLLEEAQKNKVNKFIYVSVFNAENLQFISVCRAKELFVSKLKQSGLNYCIIRPNAFFSDIRAYYKMAKTGRVVLFDKGEFKSNPISGEDLSVECVNALENEVKEMDIGGPEIKSQTEIAQLALEVLNKKQKIIYLPDWIRKKSLTTAKFILPKREYDKIDFFLTVVAMDMIAPQYGSYTIEAYFKTLRNKSK